MGPDPLVQIRLHPEEVEDGGDGQVHHERGCRDDGCIVRVIGAHLAAVGNQQRRKKDRIGLDERGFDSRINAHRRPRNQNPWKQSECQFLVQGETR